MDGVNYAIKSKNRVCISSSNIVSRKEFNCPSLRAWLGLHDLDIGACDGFASMEEWWTESMHKRGDSKMV